MQKFIHTVGKILHEYGDREQPAEARLLQISQKLDILQRTIQCKDSKKN